MGTTAVDTLDPQTAAADTGEEAVAEPKTVTGTLTKPAPDGAEFKLEEVKTARGTKSVGEVPILVWTNLEKARDYFGDEGIMDVLDGTSLRVSYQNIARRYASAGKSMDEIADAQLKFRPGKRAVGVSTPASRSANAARRAAEKLGGEAGDNIAAFLEKVAKGEVPEEQLAALGLK